MKKLTWEQLRGGLALADDGMIAILILSLTAMTRQRCSV